MTLPLRITLYDRDNTECYAERAGASELWRVAYADTDKIMLFVAGINGHTISPEQLIDYIWTVGFSPTPWVDPKPPTPCAYIARRQV